MFSYLKGVRRRLFPIPADPFIFELKSAELVPSFLDD